MDITLTTPALLFPTISLLMLAYSNRFLALASRIRDLHSVFHKTGDQTILRQIASLRHRVQLIKNTQICGMASLFSCVLCMLVLFFGQILAGQIIFGLSLVLMMVSLGYSLRELQISVQALNMQLSDIEEAKGR
jgi:hypothetical protein